MSDTDHKDDDGTLDAAEYVLGVLGVAERREVERRLARDTELAQDVAYWEERFGGLADTIPPLTPPDSAWSRIETATAPPQPPPAPARWRLGLWRSLAFWRGAAIGSAALAAVCLIALASIGITRAPRSSALLAMLGQASGQPGFVAAVGSDGKSLTIVPASLLAQDGRSMELWLIPAGDRPHSLGLIATGRAVRLDIPADLAKSLTRDAALAVSLEPLGGSPTGQPTGPVIASGKLTSL
jgi:anti-sigma-K factor RskA